MKELIERISKTVIVIDEVYKKDGDLWVKAINDNGSSMEFKIYPIGENEFSWKRGLLKMSFSDGFYKTEDQICKKREAS